MIRRNGIWLILVCTSGLMLVLMPALDSVARAEVTAAKVENSIRRGIEYLRKQQNGNGGWPEYSAGHPCGLSALATLALVTAGVPAGDPDIDRAMNYLRKFKPVDTYSASLQTLVYCQVGAAEDLPRIQRNVELLEKLQIRSDFLNSPRIGSWDYRDRPSGGGDPSNAQFALLALAAAEERGIRVSNEVFERSLDYWSRMQSGSGGWPYSYQMADTGSMTCAGIASIIICRGRLAGGSSKINGNQIDCCGASDGDERIERGLAWLANGFSVRSVPGPDMAASNLLYYLYALERVGRMSGRRLIGDHDWYREGSEVLLSMQNELQGYWAGAGPPENNRILATSFALLFLSKGKRQVVLGQLEYKPGLANKHPEAARQLVRHLERDWGRDLTWQTVKLQGSTVGDLLQTPVLQISGREPLNFTAAEKKQLKDYVEQGGFLLFEAEAGNGCGPADAFEASVQALCRELFDNPLERLPPTHPIWYAERKVDPAAISDTFWVYGVQACCRTAVAYVPATLSCRWELSDPTNRTPNPEPIERQLQAAVSLGQNIIAYATGRELKDKLDIPSVLAGDTQQRAGERGVLTIPRLALAAGGEDARRAIPNLARYVERDAPIRITTDSPMVEISTAQLEPYVVAWMHGQQSFVLSDSQVEALRQFLETGGTLLIDSICGSDAFNASVRSELVRVLPDSPLKSVPPNHPLLTSAYGGYDLSNVTLQLPQRGGSGAIAVQKKTTTAVLEASMLNGRIVVLFSPYDLSCALESQGSLQCPGYTTEDAAKIGINMLMFTLLQDGS